MSSHPNVFTGEDSSTPVTSRQELPKEPTGSVLRLPDLEAAWAPQPLLYDDDHAESLVTQLRLLEKQPREIPYYGLAKAQFRLESECQSELTLRLSEEQFEHTRDPDFVPAVGDNSESGTELHTKPRGRKNRTKSLPPGKGVRGLITKKNTSTHRYATRGRSTKDSSTPQAPDESSMAVPAPTQDSEPRPKNRTRLVRYADAMVYIQERKTFASDSSARRERQPALCVEIKVPTWPRERIGGTTSWKIHGHDAFKAISGALPQIVQQAQLVLKTHPTLSGVWACGIAGCWIAFFRFERAMTPEVDVDNLSEDRAYFRSAPGLDGGPTRYARDIPVFQTQAFKIVDADGRYTDKFKKYWHLAMETSALQWEDKEPRTAAAARKIFDDLKRRIAPESRPTSRRPSQAEIDPTTS
ncbi:hypothetical protein K488DRAFT_89584 [Vararia minispora EC-137]|uniref:Uncharacterized protein n=1 Tax=Vararia minispora EC-137 TaxID=1314806 RepID=A0ACB8QAG0_9AGAM|nr:hypothetical protein K488DRAFT_89584 [Vararia minispora EC-137]